MRLKFTVYERIAAVLPVFLLNEFTYYAASHLTYGRHRDLDVFLDRAVPFLPETSWLYLFGLISVFVLGILRIDRRAPFYRGLASILLCMAMTQPFFYLLPSMYPRPVLPAEGGLSLALTRFIYEFDPPNNTFPSLHVSVALAVSLACFQVSRRYGFFLLGLTAAVCVTTMTAKQHYFVDLVGGVVVGLVAHVVPFRGAPALRRWIRRRSDRRAGPESNRASPRGAA